MQRVSIIIIGASHRDPGPISMLRRHAGEIQKLGIPLVFCSELPCDQTLAEKQALDQLNLEFAYRALACKQIKALLQHNEEQSRPYFSALDIDNIAAALPLVLNQLYSATEAEALTHNVHVIAKYILNYLAIEESIKLDREVQTLPYQGIEQPMHLHSETGRNIRNQPGFFAAAEKTRCENMAEKIGQIAMAKTAGEDAIIICQVGALHVQRLAAEVKRYASLHLTKSDINVVPMYAYSNYCADVVEQFKSMILESQSHDTSLLREIYSTFCTPVVRLSELPNRMAFTSEAFDQVFDIALKHVAADKIELTTEARQKINAFLHENDIGTQSTNNTGLCPSCAIL